MTETAATEPASPPIDNSGHPGLVRTLPPLSPLTYYRRNISRTLPVGGAIAISVFLIAAIVTLLNSVDASVTSNYGFVRRLSILTPQLEKDVPARVVAAAGRAPHLAKMVPAIPYFLPIHTVFGEMPIPVYGINSDHDHELMKELTAISGNHLVEGRWPQANEAEIVMTRNWANNYHKKVGEFIQPNSQRVPTIPEKQQLVGILEGGESIALTDSDYLLSDLPDPVVRTSYLCIPDNPANLNAMNAFIKGLVDEPKAHGFTMHEVRYVKFYTYSGLVQELRRSLRFLYRFLAIADALVIGAVALLSGFLTNIYFEQRLGEFGLLSAFGFRRERLARRVVVETGILVIAGWIFGVAFTTFGLYLLNTLYMLPQGLILAHIDATAILYTIPAPVIVGCTSLATVLVRLYGMDPIEIMERR